MEKLLHRVRRFVERGERISPDDCRRLFEVNDLNVLSKLGRIMRERRYGLDAHFRAIETYRYRGEHPELFISEAETIAPEDTVELLLKIEWGAGDTWEGWRERFVAFSSASIPVTLSLTSSFIARAAEGANKGIPDLLSELRDAIPIQISGRDGLLFNDEWRARHAPDSISPERWLAMHQRAHEAGIRTDAGMVYHSAWNPDFYVAHLDMIRSLQQKTEGFLSFTPMEWYDSDARFLTAPTASTTLKGITIARLFLDNIPHIVVSPGMGDPETSYVALSYGADTIDRSVRPDDLLIETNPLTMGTSGELPILSEAEQGKEKRLDLGMIETRILEARFRPVPVLSNGEQLQPIDP
ncbi:MAG: hypothetical protein J4G05_08635 [Chlorobi bacterium]|nr:hypothetical protein [Chlorobiota bacterium]